MINWKFEIDGKVWDRGRRQNGIVVCRRYQEGGGFSEILYNVCYNHEGRIEYDWTSGYWLDKGHREIIE